MTNPRAGATAGLLGPVRRGLRTAGITWLRLALGDPVPLITDDGRRVSPTLVATYERGFGYGSVVVSTDLLHGAVGGRMYEVIHVDGDPAAIQHWAEAQKGAEVQLAADREGPGGDRTLQWLNLALTLVLLGYVVMGGVNNLMAATSRRASELGLLRRLGATPGQVRSMMRREALLTTGMAAVAGWGSRCPAWSCSGWGFSGDPGRRDRCGRSPSSSAWWSPSPIQRSWCPLDGSCVGAPRRSRGDARGLVNTIPSFGVRPGHAPPAW